MLLILLYHYCHLNKINFQDHLTTDLIQHQIWLTSEIKFYSTYFQKCYSSHQIWWFHKLIQKDLDEKIYEKIQLANDKLSEWNIKMMLTDKLENFSSMNELRFTFNYANIHKNLSDCHIKLMIWMHDYLSESRHELFMQTDIKHDYFSVSIYLNDQHILTFIISDIEQLQFTWMS